MREKGGKLGNEMLAQDRLEKREFALDLESPFRIPRRRKIELAPENPLISRRRARNARERYGYFRTRLDISRRSFFLPIYRVFAYVREYPVIL